MVTFRHIRKVWQLLCRPLALFKTSYQQKCDTLIQPKSSLKVVMEAKGVLLFGERSMFPKVNCVQKRQYQFSAAESLHGAQQIGRIVLIVCGVFANMVVARDSPLLIVLPWFSPLCLVVFFLCTWRLVWLRCSVLGVLTCWAKSCLPRAPCPQQPSKGQYSYAQQRFLSLTYINYEVYTCFIKWLCSVGRWASRREWGQWRKCVGASRQQSQFPDHFPQASALPS